MSAKKDPGTALVPAHLDPVDTAIVPRIGYDQYALVESEKDVAKRAFVRSSAITTGSAVMAAVGVVITGSTGIGAAFIIAAMLMSAGIMGAIGGSLFSCLNLFRMLKANRLRALPPGTDRDLVLMEGVMRDLIGTWNEQAAVWNESWNMLCDEEKSLFELKDRCESKKSLKGLIRRIEYVRNEKRKHLKVRAQLESAKDRIMSGIERLQKGLSPPEQPLYLTEGEDASDE